MQITVAQIADIPELCTLLDSLFTQEKEFKPRLELQIRGLTSLINNPDLGVVLTAKDSDSIIGMVVLLYTISTALGGRVAILEDMVVSASMRGKGVGSALISKCFEVAKQDGCLRITLLTDEDNQKAQTFYLRHGFTRSSMVAFRKLF